MCSKVVLKHSEQPLHFALNRGSGRWAHSHRYIASVHERNSIEIRLSRVSVSKFTELQIYKNQGTKTTVEKQEINSVPLVADTKTLLTGDESEVIS